jgi:hypothetical protein
MNDIIKRILVLAFVLACLVSSGYAAVGSYQMTILAPNNQICVGQPLLIEIMYNRQDIVKSEATNEVLNSFKKEKLYLEVKNDDTGTVSKYKIISTNFVLYNMGKCLYRGFINVFYDYDSKNLIFDRPGNYSIGIMNRLKDSIADYEKIIVKPAPFAEEKVLSIMSDPNDYAFLIAGVFKNAETMNHLKEVVDQCEGTVLAKWAAARVGLESFYDAENKRTELRREKKPIDEALWDESAKYLRKGLELPDDFPIRQEVLYRLIEFEGKKENYSQSILYSDELTAKYPEGEYGKKASKGKRELLELQEKKSKQTP